MKRRRRGADLERAILEAAWEVLAERGYAGLTMEAVAERAGTSRPVLARRWSRRADLAIAAIAAIRQEMTNHPLEVPDLGDVRTELLAYLDRMADRAQAMAAVITLFSSEFQREFPSSAQDLRSALLANRSSALDQILERAVGRGEILAEKLIPPVASLLTDLFRHHAVMSFSYVDMTVAAPPPELRTAWVDAIFLPLVRSR
ncbi:TetR/AcrR family transcriptional regulator [Arenibaculum pallidiluteum]|uniref:TetR/AcrR family transcriptional regulator n=1 Tax=Arenibaculum pallidiluteum TaxID=2812559 RepID=UPI001A971A0D|nr:TetR/AcrR family transcriptional regulator [Arenibaculum pallidiluteum]